MKYCQNCGAEMDDNDVFCGVCGAKIDDGTNCRQNQTQTVVTFKDDTMSTVIKVFLVLSCISAGFSIIGLAWCIPITVSIFNSLNEGRKISTGMKVCTLLFIGLVPGILLLCSDDL